MTNLMNVHILFPIMKYYVIQYLGVVFDVHHT